MVIPEFAWVSYGDKRVMASYKCIYNSNTVKTKKIVLLVPSLIARLG